MSDTRRTTKGFPRILPLTAIPSRFGLARSGEAPPKRTPRWTACVGLALLFAAMFLLTGCELLPEVGEGAALAPEAEVPLAEEGAAVGVAAAEATEWPWIEHETVIADPFEGRITDARTGEILGQFRLANNESYVDILKPGERVPARFRIEGYLDSSEPIKLVNRGGNTIATASKMADGRFLVRVLTERPPASQAGPFFPITGGANQKRNDQPSGKTTRNTAIYRYVDAHGVVHYTDAAEEGVQRPTDKPSRPEESTRDGMRPVPAASPTRPSEWHHFGKAAPEKDPVMRNTGRTDRGSPKGSPSGPECAEQARSDELQPNPSNERRDSGWHHFTPSGCPNKNPLR